MAGNYRDTAAIAHGVPASAFDWFMMCALIGASTDLNP